MRLVIALALVVACKEPVQPLTQVGVTPPAVTLTTTANAPVALADVTAAHSQTVVVFYRGFF
jgi:hypothetical protein